MIARKMLLLHNIRSTHNVGSIFRTADGAGVSKIYLSGHTPAPIDRFGRSRADIAKVSLGAELSVQWESISDPLKLIESLKKEGVLVIALEQDERSVDYREISKKTSSQPILLILGNEVGGVEKEILDKADFIAELPMQGEKESLNVSVAAGIAMYQFFG